MNSNLISSRLLEVFSVKQIIHAITTIQTAIVIYNHTCMVMLVLRCDLKDEIYKIYI